MNLHIMLIFLCLLLHDKSYVILGATNNDTINNRSILNGGVRARMRLHSSESLAPSVCRAFTNVHLSPNYNSGNSQTNSNKNVGSTSATNADGTSSNVGSSSSSSSGSLSASSLANGHAISMADKSIVSPGSRRRTYVTDMRTLSDIRRLAFKDQPTVNLSRNSYGAEQSSMLKSDPRSGSRSEQSAIMTGMCTDTRVISRQEQSVLSNTADVSAASHTSDPNVSPHADARSVLRIEQPIAGAGAAFPDSRAITRSEQSSSVLLAEDLRVMRQQPEQTTSIRVNEDLRTMRQQPEQQSATSIRVTEDLRGMRQQSEQSTNIRIGEDLRAMRQQQQQAEQSTSVRLPDDLRISRTEQSLNAPLLDQRGVSRTNQQSATISLTTDGRAASGRSEQSTVVPLTDNRTIPMTEHISPAALPDIRSVSRIPQTAGSLSSQSAAMPVAGQSSVAQQPGVLITEDVTHSEEPLPTGWEMRYDVYGRR